MTSSLRSTDPSARIHVVDLWRGFALLGVCVVNFIHQNSLFLSPDQAAALPTASFDWKVNALSAIFLANKSHTIFTFLFGVSFGILFERAARSEADPTRILVRRMTILLFVGWAHLFLVFAGEELHVYAICGFLLLALRRVSTRTLVVLGVGLAVLPRLLYEERALFGFVDAATVPSAPLDDPAAMRATLESAPAWSLVALNARLAAHQLADVPLKLAYGAYFFGRMLLGYAFWRSGACRALLALPTRRLAALAGAAGTVALVLTLGVLADFGGARGTALHFAYNAVRQLDFLAMAAFYLLALALAVRNDSLQRFLRPLCALGRTSLTTYLTQSVLIVVLLSGPGLRLAGAVGVAAVTALALVVYVAQIAFSTAWLKHFDQGPAEWAWRRLTYGRPAPRRAQ